MDSPTGNLQGPMHRLLRRASQLFNQPAGTTFKCDRGQQYPSDDIGVAPGGGLTFEAPIIVLLNVSCKSSHLKPEIPGRTSLYSKSNKYKCAVLLTKQKAQACGSRGICRPTCNERNRYVGL